MGYANLEKCIVLCVAKWATLFVDLNVYESKTFMQPYSFDKNC